MVAAIEANLNETFSLLGSSPSTQLHDDDPDLRWYITPKVPHPLFNHVYLTRLPQEEDLDARIEELRKHFALHQLPLMWSVGPFRHTSPHDVGHIFAPGLARAYHAARRRGRGGTAGRGAPWPTRGGAEVSRPVARRPSRCLRQDRSLSAGGPADTRRSLAR